VADIQNQQAAQVDLMVAALMHLGLSQLAALEFTDNGITTMNRLRSLNEESLGRLIKQIHRDNQGAGLLIPFASQQYLHAIRFWANRMYIIGSPYDINDVNEPLAEMWVESIKAEKEAATVAGDMVKLPEAFKKDTKWRQWKESLTTYIHSKIGQAGIPLAYIIRENDLPTPGEACATVHDQLVHSAILHGAEYNMNNGVVYDLLQSLTLNGPAWSWVNAYQRNHDGRGAWRSLIAYYEGDTMQARSKQECYDVIAKASYQGHKRNFDFGSYVAILQQAHQDLVCLVEPIPENKKVRDFLHGISDPQCNSIKLNVLSNPIYMNNFAQAINYMASAIDMISKNSLGGTGQISDVNSHHGNQGRGNNGQGRGGHGRQGRRNNNRGGRGRGNGRGCGRQHGRGNNPDYNSQDGASIRGYSREEWQNMPCNQRNQIIREGERMATARAVASMLRDEYGSGGNADDISTITTPTTNAGSQASTGNNGTSGSTRSINQLSLDNAGQAFNMRRLNVLETKNKCQVRSIASLQKPDLMASEILYCHAELDSHAYTCGVNNVAKFLEYSGQVAQVSGFANSMTPIQDVPIVKAALAVDDPATGETTVIIINQALYFGDLLSHALLNPNQLRANDATVDDIPKHLSSKSMHSITINEENFSIPLKLKGVISYFDVRTPSLHESENCSQINLTSDIEWNPYSPEFEELENKAAKASPSMGISSQNINCIYLPELVYQSLHQKIEEPINISLATTNSKHLFVSSQQLAKR